MATNMWASSHPYIVGFTGFGTLGGGNLQHRRGRRRRHRGGARPGRLWRAGTAQQPPLVAAVGGTGRVAPDGSLVLTGGGDLRLRLGGALNPTWTPRSTPRSTGPIARSPTWTAW